jgi:hypothetical protein
MEEYSAFAELNRLVAAVPVLLAVGGSSVSRGGSGLASRRHDQDREPEPGVNGRSGTARVRFSGMHGKAKLSDACFPVLPPRASVIRHEARH